MYSVHKERKSVNNVANKLLTKVLNSKLLILLEYQNMKIFLQNFILLIGLRSFSD